MNDITEPLVLAAGSHQAGEGRGCAMNVISWENGDVEITDYPACSDPFLASLVQVANDKLADPTTELLSAEDSLIALELGHATVGTSNHGLTAEELRMVYVLTIQPYVDEAITRGDGMWVEGMVTDMSALSTGSADSDQRRKDAYWALRYASIANHAGPDVVEGDVPTEKWVEIVREVVARFKTLTAITSPAPDPQVVACAVEKMRAVV